MGQDNLICPCSHPVHYERGTKNFSPAERKGYYEELSDADARPVYIHRGRRNGAALRRRDHSMADVSGHWPGAELCGPYLLGRQLHRQQCGHHRELFQ